MAVERGNLSDFTERLARAATLSLGNVSKTFVNRSNGNVANGLKVLDDLDLVFNAGTIVGLVGRTGVGKTTLGKILGGLLKPDVGSVQLGDVSLLDLSPKEMLALRQWLRYVPQNPDAVVPPRITVAVALREGSYRSRLSPAEAQEWEREVRHTVMFDASWSERLVGNLSLGERRRIINLRSLQACPKFVILDEPFNGLDLVTKQSMLSFLQRTAHERRIGVFMISHDVEALAEVCDTIWHLENGKLSLYGC